MSTNFLFSKVCWHCPAMFCLYTSSKLFQPSFELSLKVKVMGSNPGYLLKYFLLSKNYFTALSWQSSGPGSVRHPLPQSSTGNFVHFVSPTNWVPFPPDLSKYLKKKIYVIIQSKVGHGLLYKWTELLYLTCQHEADLLTLMMSQKLTQYL